jgi:hypothetical protein
MEETCSSEMLTFTSLHSIISQTTECFKIVVVAMICGESEWAHTYPKIRKVWRWPSKGRTLPLPTINMYCFTSSFIRSLTLASYNTQIKKKCIFNLIFSDDIIMNQEAEETVQRLF